jgi:SAM-dependent methyltransferase
MKAGLIKHLVCPECLSGLSLDIYKESAGEIQSGQLSCHQAGHAFPIVRFVPRFVDTETYADSFSIQRLYVRKHFKYYKNDNSGDRLFLPTTGFDGAQLATGITLEVGCGYGRFVDVAQRLGATIVGIDLSTHSIDLAQDFVGLRENVHLVQCDLFRLPFRRLSFDRIYSIGVMHHTPDTEQAFRAVVPYVRPEGQISIWVYEPVGKVHADRWRSITTRLPHRMLYSWCIANQILFSWIRGLPGGWRFSAVIPGDPPGPNRAFWLRVMSDFDDLSPRYAHSHTAGEVCAWFEAAGLEKIRVLERATSVTGWKPAALV